MKTADDLIKIFGLKDDKELADLFGRDKSVVSHWRKKGLPAAIEKKAFQLMADRGMVADPQEAYGSGPRFQVVQIEPKKEKASSPLAAAILAIVEAMTPEQQAAELKRLTDQFTASQTTEKS